jgi:uncharacterized membrane protein YesL
VASRAEAIRPDDPGARRPQTATTAGPSLGGAIHAALADLYFHSWRLVPANLVWSVVAIASVVAFVAVPAGILLAPILALPTAGIFRMTAEIARGEAVSFRDALAAWRTETLAELGLGAALLVAAGILAVNLASGIVLGSVLGWAFATLAFWGLLGTWLYAWAAWPVLADPRRARWPVRARLQLAGLLVLAHPVRLVALGLVLGIFLVASLIAIVALVTVSVAVAALVASRLVLPAIDRLDDRLGFGLARGLSFANDDEAEEAGA